MTATLFRTIELLNKIILQKDQLLLGLQEKDHKLFCCCPTNQNRRISYSSL
jgi:hypothetical protein